MFHWILHHTHTHIVSPYTLHTNSVPPDTAQACVHTHTHTHIICTTGHCTHQTLCMHTPCTTRYSTHMMYHQTLHTQVMYPPDTVHAHTLYHQTQYTCDVPPDATHTHTNDVPPDTAHGQTVFHWTLCTHTLSTTKYCMQTNYELSTHQYPYINIIVLIWSLWWTRCGCANADVNVCEYREKNVVWEAEKLCVHGIFSLVFPQSGPLCEPKPPVFPEMPTAVLFSTAR
jgi:hypothetical protein